MTSCRRRVSSFLLLVVCLVLGGCDILSSESGPRHLEVIGPGTGGSLNDRGEVAFTRREAAGTPRPMLYRDGTTIPLPLHGDSGRAVDINDRGDVLGFDPRPVVWKADGTVVPLEVEGDTLEVVLHDLNDAGTTVGGWRPLDEPAWTRFTPLRWDAGGAVETLPVSAIELNHGGDLLGPDTVLFTDGSVLVAPEPGPIEEFVGITNDRRVFKRFMPFDDPVVQELDAVGDELRTHGGAWDVAFNDAGDVAYREESCGRIGGSCTFSHRFVPADGKTISLDTLPEFPTSIPGRVSIAGVNERRLILIEGPIPALDDRPGLALYRHAAFTR